MCHFDSDWESNNGHESTICKHCCIPSFSDNLSVMIKIFPREFKQTAFVDVKINFQFARGHSLWACDLSDITPLRSAFNGSPDVELIVIRLISTLS
jgi:hypothetical protein